jgi:hypothetical protein
LYYLPGTIINGDIKPQLYYFLLSSEPGILSSVILETYFKFKSPEIELFANTITEPRFGNKRNSRNGHQEIIGKETAN